MAILEKEISVVLQSSLVMHLEKLNYNIPRRRDKWGTLTVPKGTEINVKVEDLPKGSHVKLTKICDNKNCDVVGGRLVPNIQYRSILKSREDNNGQDLCHKCSYLKRGDTRKNSVNYENSLEYFAIENGKKHLLFEFSNNNEKKPKYISKATHDKYLWNCLKCGEKDYEMSVANRTTLNQNCPVCAGNIKKTNDQYKQEIFDLVSNEYDVLGEYINARTPIKMKHNICNHVYYVSPNNFSRGRRCPLCSESKGEKRIRKWLEENQFMFESQKEFDGLIGTGKGNLSYDFYLPKQNLLIEYQGEFHDGSSGDYTSENLENQIEHDNRKKIFANEKGIVLLEIWYWDFDNVEKILSRELF